jgi:protoporphyrin/coproporphyrin ferrochelatase
MNCFGCRGSTEKIGVLIAQLGSPQSPHPSDVRRYLRQFLSDRRVIEVNRIVWWFILHFIVLVTRPRRSGRLYSRIWTDKGSPLVVTTQEQAGKVEKRVRDLDPHAEVAFGMRYGTPSLESGLQKLLDKGCTKVLLFPMYPQYSATTSASTYDVVFSFLLKRRWVPTLRVAAPYYLDPRYVQAVATTINEAVAKLPHRPEKLVLSYHGIPEKYIEKGDPYCCMCTETTEALRPLLDFPPADVIHTFQSRFGKDPWLVPYTDETLEELATKGVKTVAVACPGFPADCLETLDEIGNEGRDLFVEKGGKELYSLPCLNVHPAWIEAMAGIIKDELGSWLEHSRERKAACASCPTAMAKAAANG